MEITAIMNIIMNNYNNNNNYTFWHSAWPSASPDRSSASSCQRTQSDLQVQFQVRVSPAERTLDGNDHRSSGNTMSQSATGFDSRQVGKVQFGATSPFGLRASHMKM
jgi:hypothetical protein